MPVTASWANVMWRSLGACPLSITRSLGACPLSITRSLGACPLSITRSPGACPLPVTESLGACPLPITRSPGVCRVPVTESPEGALQPGPANDLVPPARPALPTGPAPEHQGLCYAALCPAPICPGNLQASGPGAVVANSSVIDNDMPRRGTEAAPMTGCGP